MTAEGERRCLLLAEELRTYKLSRVFTSTEAKARATGRILAATLAISSQAVPHLQETMRGDGDYYADQAEFSAAIALAIQQGDRVSFGREAFGAARDRFSQQMHALMQQHPGETLALVSHGRVLSMVLGALLGRDPFEIWQSLEMPAYAALEYPTMRLVQFTPALGRA